MRRRLQKLGKIFRRSASGSSLPAKTPSSDSTTAQEISNDTSSYSTETHTSSSLPHATDPPADADLRPKDRQPVTKSTEQQTPEPSISQRLWNAAYDSLEKDKDTAELADSYMKTLIKVINAKGASNASTSKDEFLAELKDPIKRQEYMKKLVDEGQKKVNMLSKILGAAEDVTQFIFLAKEMITAAIQNIPQAALPWAGVCIGLQILLNPTKATKTNLTGITHVTSRMKWYCVLTEHLLSEKSITVGNESFAAVINSLEETIVALYKALILYQMKSACTYYRNQGIIFLRNLANLDDWDGDFDGVKKAEADVEKMLAQYYGEYEKSSLSQLVDSAEEMKMQLGSIQLALRDFIAQQSRAQIDAELTECLRSLYVVDPQDEINTIQRKKDVLLDDAFRWILGTKQFAALINWDNDTSTLPPCRLLWIKGPAGTGKTMLLIGIIRELINHSAAFAPRVSYFFCQGTDSTRNSATAVLRSLLWMLLIQQPHLSSHLYAKYKYSGDSLFTGPNAYSALSNVFESMLKDPNLSRAYLIVDALDECSQDSAPLIQLILTSISVCDKVKWLVSSRPEVELNTSETAETLVELDAQSLEDPVNVYINHKLSILKTKKGYTENTLAEISNEIHQRAANIFLWVALVFKQLDRVHGWDAIETIQKMPAGLSELYDHMMVRIEKLSDRQYCKNVLVAASLAYRPLSLPELSVLAGMPAKVHLQTIVEECGSFLTTRDKVVYLIHQSAKDYLDTNYATKLQEGGLPQGHMDICKRSIKAIKTLPKNIYNLPHFGFRPKDAQPPNPDPLAPMQYACLFWADHFCNAHRLSSEPKNKLADNEIVWLFLKDYILRWVEGLSLFHKLPDGLRSIRKILQVLQTDINPQLTRFLEDAEKFLLSNGSIIDRAPLQIYGSALVFSLQLNKVKQQQWKEKLPFIKDIKGIKEYDIHLQTLEGHGDSVRAVDLSPDGKILASASRDQTIRLWDATTGTHQQTLEGHGDSVRAVAFSPDGKILASASRDETIRLWDAATGTHQQTLKGHGGSVTAVAFSPDGKILASASHDWTIRLWDATTGTHQQTLKGHGDWVRAVAFSPDGKILASASDDQTIRLWDAATGTHQQTLEGHGDVVTAVAFSPDGKILASTSYDQTIRLWDATTGTHQQTLEGHGNWVTAVAFSPDGKILASASGDQTIRLWDAATGTHQQTLEGHGNWVRAVAFSPDGKILASASDDQTIRLWDAATGTHQQTLESHGGSVTAVAFSPDGKILASASRDRTIRLWDATTGTHQQTLEGHGDVVTAVAFSPDGKILASTSYDQTIRLWDAATGTHQQTLEGHGDVVTAVAFSPDGKILASTSYDQTIRLWDAATGTHQQTLEGHGNWVRAVAFSPDGKILASASGDQTIRLWDAATGTHQQTLEGHGNWVRAVAFSPDGKILASASGDQTIQLWDAATGTHQQTLEGHGDVVTAVAFSPDGKILASASRDRTIRLWDATTGTHQQTLEGHGDSVNSIIFSTDNQFLKTNRGYIRISRSSTPFEPSGHAFFFNDEWITRDGKDLLWLPKDYRAQCVAMRGNIIVLGHGSRVTFLQFNI